MQATPPDFDRLLGQLQTSVLGCSLTSMSQISQTVDDVDRVVGAIAVCKNNTFLCESMPQSEVEATLKQTALFLASALKALVQGSTRDDDDDGGGALTNRVAQLLAQLARMSGDAETVDGDGATVEWVFGSNLFVVIKELSFQDASFGWQTWSGGALFAYLISIGRIPVKDETILELGCGTGIAGITACKVGAKHVFMTDYHQKVLESTMFNVSANDCCDKASVHTLDWTWIAENAPIQESAIPAFDISDSTKKFDVILGADICYDPIHGKLVPPVCDRFLSSLPRAKIYFVTGLRRDKFAQDISYFEKQMEAFQFTLDHSEDISTDDFLESALALKTDPLEKRMMAGLGRAIFKGSDPQFRFYIYTRNIPKLDSQPVDPYIEFESRFDSFTTSLFDPTTKQDLNRVLSLLTELESLISIITASNLENSALSVVDPNHVSILQKQGNRWLTDVENYWSPLSIAGADDVAVDSVISAIKHTKSSIQALSASSTSQGVTKQWKFTPEISLSLRELSFEECAYGWQTWSGGQLLAHLLSTHKIPHISTLPPTSTTLELGCGTGIVGLTLSKTYPTRNLVMTDYMPTILSNARLNASQNACPHETLTIEKLDWRDPSTFPKQRFDLIIAADVCYEFEHGSLVPPVCEALLSRDVEARVVVLLTLRIGFSKEVKNFEEGMEKSGFTVEMCVDIDRDWVLRNGDKGDGCLEGIVGAVFNGPDQEFRLYTFARSIDV
ncbi:UNVERIFIED_CONTAM: hypothetical protein HDU68_012861 [Siphonaria sp. JEL0065]|nr:hypothetical protein HDU68_012861 [Siphonaria sp. JEL0065]